MAALETLAENLHPKSAMSQAEFEPRRTSWPMALKNPAPCGVPAGIEPGLVAERGRRDHYLAGKGSLRLRLCFQDQPIRSMTFGKTSSDQLPAGRERSLAGKPLKIASPDGEVQAGLQAADGVLRYRIMVDGTKVLAPSRLGILSDGVELGQGVALGVDNIHLNLVPRGGFVAWFRR